MTPAETPGADAGASTPRDWRVPAWAAIGAAVLVGAWIRASLALGSGLWRDEVQSLTISRLPTLTEMFRFLVREESHPPLFYLFERAWTSVFGASDFAVIALGLIPASALILLAGLIAWRWSGPAAGVAAAWFVALAWPLVWQGGDGRPYALLSVLTLVATSSALSAVARAGMGAWVTYGVSSVALLYTHNWAALVVASLGVLTLYAVLAAPGPGHRGLRPWALAHALVLACWLPWVPSFLIQAREAGYPPPTAFPVQWVVIVPIVLLGVIVHLFLPSVAVLVLGTWGRRTSRPRPDPVRFLAGAAVLPCLLAAAAWRVTNLTIIHCAQILVPLVLLALALSLGSRRLPRLAALRQCIAAACFAGLLASSLVAWSPGKSNLREVARVVAANAEPGDLVVVYPSTLAPSFRRYAPVDLEVVTFPSRMVAGPTRFATYAESFGDPEEIRRALASITRAGQAGRRTWLLRLVLPSRAEDSSAAAGTHERWRHNYHRRLAEVDSALRVVYGPPGLVSPADDSNSVREFTRVHRFALPWED